MKAKQWLGSKMLSETWMNDQIEGLGTGARILTVEERRGLRADPCGHKHKFYREELYNRLRGEHPMFEHALFLIVYIVYVEFVKCVLSKV